MKNKGTEVIKSKWNNALANELHNLVIRNVQKTLIAPTIINSIWYADIAPIQLNLKIKEGIFL